MGLVFAPYIGNKEIPIPILLQLLKITYSAEKCSTQILKLYSFSPKKSPSYIRRDRYEILVDTDNILQTIRQFLFNKNTAK